MDAFVDYVRQMANGRYQLVVVSNDGRYIVPIVVGSSRFDESWLGGCRLVYSRKAKRWYVFPAEASK